MFPDFELARRAASEEGHLRLAAAVGRVWRGAFDTVRRLPLWRLWRAASRS